jgi:hypothetical protein
MENVQHEKSVNMKYSQGPVRKGHFIIIFNVVKVNWITRKHWLRQNYLVWRIKFTFNVLISQKKKRSCSNTRYGNKGLLKVQRIFFGTEVVLALTATMKFAWEEFPTVFSILNSVVLCLFRRLHYLCKVLTHTAMKYWSASRILSWYFCNVIIELTSWEWWSFSKFLFFTANKILDNGNKGA